MGNPRMASHPGAIYWVLGILEFLLLHADHGQSQSGNGHQSNDRRDGVAGLGSGLHDLKDELAFHHLMVIIQSGGIDQVVLADLGESRNLTDIMTIMGSCLKKGINIYTVKERYRFDDSINSKILCFAFGLVAEIERNLISLRTKEALALRKSEGVVLGRPVGSRTKQQILQDNEPEVLRMLEAGHTVRSICRRFKVSKDTWYRYWKVRQPHP